MARRLSLGARSSFSAFIIRVAIIAVALSVAVMIVAGAIVHGFQKEISGKIFGFWGHIVIRNYAAATAYGEEPLSKIQPFYPSLEAEPGIRHIQVYATKAGIIKANAEIEGIVLRGIGEDFDWTFLKQYLTEGSILNTGDTAAQRSILISQVTANRLKLKVGDDVLVYFIQEPLRYRKLKITGIYKTGLEEYDRLYALVDLALIQRLNGWSMTEVGGFEVLIDDVSRLDELGRLVNEKTGQSLEARTLRQINPNLFDWLDLQNMNERVIMVLMIVIAMINMTTALLILILERTQMIGILKSLGGSDWMIRKIFLYQAGYIITIGLLAGNLAGIGISLLQHYFHFIRLDEASYYVSVAPVLIDPVYVALINAGTFAICMLTLLLPSFIVSRISPLKAIRFE